MACVKQVFITRTVQSSGIRGFWLLCQAGADGSQRCGCAGGVFGDTKLIEICQFRKLSQRQPGSQSRFGA